MGAWDRKLDNNIQQVSRDESTWNILIMDLVGQNKKHCFSPPYGVHQVR